MVEEKENGVIVIKRDPLPVRVYARDIWERRLRQPVEEFGPLALFAVAAALIALSSSKDNDGFKEPSHFLKQDVDDGGRA